MTLRYYHPGYQPRSATPKPSRRPVPTKVRRALKRAQGEICPGCGGSLRENFRGFEHTGDHVIPISRGGPDAVGNLLCLHRRCNEAKGDRWPTACELIWLMAVNARLGVGPVVWKAAA